MALSSENIRAYTRRLLLSRMRILCENGFYGLLLMHMTYAIDETLETAATDGMRIWFGPDFLESLSDEELDFVMMHEILHVVLQHCLRQGDRDQLLFNIACDIVVNSNILRSNKMDLNSITLRRYGESMHIAPNGREGFEYTAEETYEMLLKKGGGSFQGGKNGNGGGMSESGKGSSRGSSTGNGGTMPANHAVGSGHGGRFDDHSRWGTNGDEALAELWVKRFREACEAVTVRDPSNQRGLLPAFAERLLKELQKPQTDWRTILNDFVQEEVTDYSFSPPDRRFDGDFFLPDFNEKEDLVEDILFMIDTSGSMSDKMVTAAYSEVKGAIDQFDGKLKGWLGFFDGVVIDPKPFESEEEFKIIKPVGGGGTSFHAVFEYVAKNMQEGLPASVIILTDGYAPFPNEDASLGIPVLWLLNNDKVTPPWGKIARITV